MKLLSIPFGGLLVLLLSLSACKKAEQPAEPAAGRDQAAPTPASASSTAASGAAPDSAESFLLKPKWPVGSRSVYRMESEQQSTNKVPQLPAPMQQQVRSAMTYALSVLKETADGGREVELEILDNAMQIQMAGQTVLDFDSKKPSEPSGPQAMFAAPFRKMPGSKVRLQLNADGALEEVLNLDQWVQSLTSSAQSPMGPMLAQQFNEGFFRQLADFSSALPQERVAVGQSWPFKVELPGGPLGNITADAKITFKGFEQHDTRNCAILETTGTFHGPSEQAGGLAGSVTVEDGNLKSTSWFDADAGTLVETATQQSLRFAGAMSGADGTQTQFTSAMAQTTRMKLVERGTAKP